MAKKVAVCGALLIGITVIFSAQFSIPTLFSADGYLHIRMAQFLRDLGPRYDFHWAKFSTFTQNFADKDFLYHVFLIPFTLFPDIFWGAKLSAAFFASLLFLVFWLVLRRYCKPGWAVAGLLWMFLCAPGFLQMLSQPRNMVLVFVLLIFSTHFLIQKRAWLLFFCALVYALAHVSGPYLLLFALILEATRYAGERDFCWKNIRAAGLGVALGLLLHPNFPNNLLVFYLNGVLVSLFALKWGLELGAEFFPIDTRSYALGYPLLLVAVLLFIVMGLSRDNKITAATKMWLAIAGYFFVFSFFSQRYLAYAYPLILLALGSYFSDWWQSGRRIARVRENRGVSAAAIAVACVFLGLLGAHTFREFKERCRGELIYNRHYEAVGKWMAENLPAGETVFHANWSDAQYLIGLNPKDDYFVTLDPVYMYYWNPEKYKLYREISFGNNKDPYQALKKDFGVNYGYAGKNYFSGLINQVKADPRFEVLAEDGMGVIFKLK